MTGGTYGSRAGFSARLCVPFCVPFCVIFVTEPFGRPRPRLVRTRCSILTITCSIRSRSARNSASIFAKSVGQLPS